MDVKVVAVGNKIHVDFSEDICIDLSKVPNFIEHVESIYNNYLSTCISNAVLLQIKCELVNLLNMCKHAGALFYKSEFPFIRYNGQMLILSKSFVYDNHFIKQISKFEFVFGEIND